jgi:hypothetical protein
VEFGGEGNLLEWEADGINSENYQCRALVLIRPIMRSWVLIPR